MITYDYKILGYHVNFESKVNDFISNNVMHKSNDHDFLGTGMYFWDNIDDSYYWTKKKKKDAIREKLKEPVVTVSAYVFYNSEQLLDLSSPTTFYRIMGMKKILAKVHSKGISSIDYNSLPLGMYLDALFDSSDSYIRKLMDNYKVLKISLRYSGYKPFKIISDVDFYNKKLPSKIDIDFSNKVIYNVRNNDNICFKCVINKEVAS